MLGLTACKEDETDKDNSIVENFGDKVNGDIENNEVDDENAGITVEDGKEEESESEEKEEPEEEIQQEEPEIIKAELLMETDKYFYYIENGELKDVEYTNSVSVSVKYRGKEYPISFRYVFIYGECWIQQTSAYNEECSCSVETIPECEDKFLISIYIGDDAQYYIYSIDTEVLEQICTEAFWGDKLINDVSVAADAKTKLVHTGDEIYYCEGDDIRPIGTRVKTACPEMDYMYAVFEEDKVIIVCEMHTDQLWLSYYTYNPIADEISCAGEKLSSRAWHRLNSRFYCGVNADGYFQITDILSGRTSVTGLRNIDTSAEYKTDRTTYVFATARSGLIYVVNMRTGRTECAIDLGIKLESWDSWYVMRSDEGIYIEVNDEQYADKQVWKIFKVGISE